MSGHDSYRHRVDAQWASLIASNPMEPEDRHGLQQTLLERLANKDAVIGVVGLGYVGLPLSLTFMECGYRMLGLDVDAAKVEALQAGRSTIAHIVSERVCRAFAAGRLKASTDFGRAAEADVLILCVPTPLTRYREPDLGFIHRTMAALTPHLRPGQVISLESTTYSRHHRRGAAATD